MIEHIRGDAMAQDLLKGTESILDFDGHQLGFARAYVSGDIQIDGDLVEAFRPKKVSHGHRWFLQPGVRHVD